jgi:N-acetylmuramoyl-L-alanine amidase
MIKIILAAGHGPGDNRGGVCYNEGNNNYHYSLALKKELDTYDNVQTDLLRKNITDNPDLTDRAKAGSGYDLYLAIHSNAFSDSSVRGTEVWDSVEKPNLSLAKLICDVTAALFKHNNRKVKYKDGQPGVNWYGELRFNQARSAMIVEHGFHTNPEDCNFFKNNHKQLAVAQTRVIASYYGLKKKAIRETEEHWAEVHYENLKKKGIEIFEKRFDDSMTRGEVFAILDRLTDKIGG